MDSALCGVPQCSRKSEKKVEGYEGRFQDDRLRRASKWFPTRGHPFEGRATVDVAVDYIAVWISGHPKVCTCAALSSVGVPHVSANSTVGVRMGSCSRAASENLQ